MDETEVKVGEVYKIFSTYAEDDHELSLTLSTYENLDYPDIRNNIVVFKTTWKAVQGSLVKVVSLHNGSGWWRYTNAFAHFLDQPSKSFLLSTKFLIPTTENTKINCTCELQLLMHKGCQCGGI